MLVPSSEEVNDHAIRQQHESIVDDCIRQLWEATCCLCRYARTSGELDREWITALHTSLDRAVELATAETPEEAYSALEKVRKVIFGNANP